MPSDREAVALESISINELIGFHNNMSKKDSGAATPVVDVGKFCQHPTDCDSKRVAAIGLYQAKMATTVKVGKQRYKVRLYHLLFVAGYLILGYHVLSTIGEPYRIFLEKADREGFQGKTTSLSPSAFCFTIEMCANC